MPGEDIERGGDGGSGGFNGRESNSHGSSPSYLIEETETQWTSWLVPIFVVANVVVFVVAMYINNCPQHFHSRFEGKCVARFLGRFSFEPLRTNPLFGPSSITLEKLGGLEWTKLVSKHQGWRLVACIWLHAGIIHFLANMLSLIFIGIRLEQQFGFVRIGAIYLLSGFGGSVLSALFIRNNISVSASGALLGLLGAMLSELITNWTIYSKKAAALLTIVFIIAINLAIGILPHVDNFAHIGGFLSGVLLGLTLLPGPQYARLDHRNLPCKVGVKSKYRAYQYALRLTSVALLIGG